MTSNDGGVPRGDNVASEQDKADSVRRQEANTRGEGVGADAAKQADSHGGHSGSVTDPRGSGSK